MSGPIASWEIFWASSLVWACCSTFVSGEFGLIGCARDEDIVWLGGCVRDKDLVWQIGCARGEDLVGVEVGFGFAGLMGFCGVPSVRGVRWGKSGVSSPRGFFKIKNSSVDVGLSKRFRRWFWAR